MDDGGGERASQRDGLLRVTKLEHQYLTANQADNGYSNLGTFEYGYDASSNALSAVQTATMDELDADRWYAYDTLNRLITGRVKDMQNWSAATTKTSWYNYDDLGNRVSHQYRDAAAIGYEHDKANRMTTLADKTQGYDQAGNLTLAYSADRGTSYQYQYDHHNRLTGVYDGATGTTRKAAFTCDALGRRIEFINDVLATTVRYYYDGVNEIVETDGQALPQNQRTYVHGLSYVDERLMMKKCSTSRPYYYVLDRMYDVWLLLDRAGAVVERYAYDEYGRPLIRESAGRGDMDNDTDLDLADLARVAAARNGTIWDPRADLDDDGDCDSTDYTMYLAKDDNWPPASSPTVAQAFSDVGNPFGFQGRVHFALDTAANATDGKLMVVDNRNRMNDPVTGRWITRDPLIVNSMLIKSPGSTGPESLAKARPQSIMTVPVGLRVDDATVVGSVWNSRRNPFSAFSESPISYSDPSGLADSCAFNSGVWSWTHTSSSFDFHDASARCWCHYTSSGRTCMGTCCSMWKPHSPWPCVGTPNTATVEGVYIVDSPHLPPNCSCATPTSPAGGTCDCG